MTYISTRLKWATGWATLAEQAQRAQTKKKLKPVEKQALDELLNVLMDMKANEK